MNSEQWKKAYSLKTNFNCDRILHILSNSSEHSVIALSSFSVVIFGPVNYCLCVPNHMTHLNHQMVNIFSAFSSPQSVNKSGEKKAMNLRKWDEKNGRKETEKMWKIKCQRILLTRLERERATNTFILWQRKTSVGIVPATTEDR